MTSSAWPELVYSEWSDTCETLHLWTQVIGKIRMAKTPPLNHWWHVVLYVTSRGLGTSPIPDGERTFDIDFDFIEHVLRIVTTDGGVRELALQPMTVAEFYGRVMSMLAELEIAVTVDKKPCEIPNPIHFDADTVHAAYDRDAVSRFWRVLVSTCQVFTRFRSEFIGKVSPVHFFWGGADLAVTRFSGRTAPEHGSVPLIPDKVVREAYSHQVSSAGFWPGGPGADAAFYSYAYPAPPGLESAKVSPSGAFYSNEMGEFLLPYSTLRASASPGDDLMAFLRTTYEAEATLGEWPREELERR